MKCFTSEEQANRTLTRTSHAPCIRSDAKLNPNPQLATQPSSQAFLEQSNGASHAKDLIISLLDLTPDMRPNATAVKRYSFFTGQFNPARTNRQNCKWLANTKPNTHTPMTGLDFAALEKGALQPPHVPSVLADRLDSSHYQPLPAQRPSLVTPTRAAAACIDASTEAFHAYESIGPNVCA